MRIKIPYITTSLEKDIITTIYLIPLWWILGFGIFIYQAITFWLLIKLIVLSSIRNEPIKVPKVVFFLGLLIVIYGFSLVVNLPQNEMIRTVASLNNYSLWVMGFMLVIIIYNSFDISSVQTLVKPFFFNITVAGILAGISLFLWFAGVWELRYPSLLFKMLPWMKNIPLLKANATITLLATDWFAGRPFPRITSLASHPIGLGVLFIMVIPLVYARYRENLTAKIFMSIGLLTFILTLARTPFLSFIIALGAVYILYRKHKIVLGIFASAMIVFTFPFLIDVFNQVSGLRMASSLERFEVYKYTIDLAWQKSLLIGTGIKPRENWVDVPIGSHSLYLSLLLKSGLIGLFSFVAFQVHVLKIWFRTINIKMAPDLKLISGALGVSLIATPLFITTGDLDASQLGSFLYFILVGTLVVILREVLNVRLQEN